MSKPRRQANAVTVTIGNVTYPDMKTAALHLGMEYTAFRNYINSGGDPDKLPRVLENRCRTRTVRKVKANLSMGSIKRHLTDEQYLWLDRNLPRKMTVAEYLVTALLTDAMNED